MHVNRLKPDLRLQCQLYTYPYETVERCPFECLILTHMMNLLLSPKPYQSNTLYETKQKLMNAA